MRRVDSKACAALRVRVWLLVEGSPTSDRQRESRLDYGRRTGTGIVVHVAALGCSVPHHATFRTALEKLAAASSNATGPVSGILSVSTVDYFAAIWLRSAGIDEVDPHIGPTFLSSEAARTRPNPLAPGENLRSASNDRAKRSSGGCCKARLRHSR